jgi:hypothetical protein
MARPCIAPLRWLAEWILFAALADVEARRGRMARRGMTAMSWKSRVAKAWRPPAVA